MDLELIIKGLIQNNFKLLKWLIQCLKLIIISNDKCWNCIDIVSQKVVRNYIFGIIHFIVRRSGTQADRHIKYFVDNNLLSTLIQIWQQKYQELTPQETEYIVLLFGNIFSADSITIKNVIVNNYNILDIICQALSFPATAVTAVFFINGINFRVGLTARCS